MLFVSLKKLYIFEVLSMYKNENDEIFKDLIQTVGVTLLVVLFFSGDI